MTPERRLETPPGSPDAPDDRFELLEHFDWVRDLARSLVRDRALADDLCQDTWVAALRGPKPPHASEATRGWLARILRNRIRETRRSEARRRSRECDAAQQESQPSAEELVQRVAEQRRVVDAVLGLEEPFRNTLLLRYFEGLTPPAIAAREGAPLATVKTRLRRGLERLRVQLDREHGSDGRSWMAALLPLVSEPGASAGGALLMTGKTWTWAAPVCVLTVLGGWWWMGREPAAPPTVAAARPVEAAMEAPVPAEAPEPVSTPEQRVERALEDGGQPAAALAAEEPALLLEGRVIDVQGGALARADVVFTPEGGAASVLAQSGPDGGFEWELPGESGELRARLDGYANALQVHVRSNQQTAATLVLARAGEFAGEVVDGSGAPLAGSEVRFRLASGTRGSFDTIMDNAAEPLRSLESDADGLFSLSEVPLVPGSSITASLPNYASASVTIGEQSDAHLRLVLLPLDEGPAQLAGRVLDARGNPVEDAWVALGRMTTRSGVNGRFVVEREAGRDDVTTLRALAPGWLPAEIHRDESAGEDWKDGWPRPLELVLQGQPLAIAGRVLDSGGDPVAGVQVSLDETTAFGMTLREFDGVDIYMEADAESLLRGSFEPIEIATDERGEFRIEGLLARDYDLTFCDRSTLTQLEVGPVTAGEEALRIEWVEARGLVRVRGRVLSLSGEPMAQVSVRPYIAEPLADGALAWPDFYGEPAVSAADGTFEFEALPRENLCLSLQGGPEVSALDMRVENDLDLDDLEIRVAQRAHFRIDLGDRPEWADSFRVVNEEDETLMLTMGMGEVMLHNVGAWFENGRTDVYGVDERARAIVLTSAEEEVARLPIELTPGEVLVVRP